MQAQRKRILITVKTYPNPSDKYDETVCTAGIDLQTGRLVRLYPVRFRHLGFDAQFKKWDVVELDAIHKHSDPRGDTWTPVGDCHEVIRHIGTGKGKPPDWAERIALVSPLASTLEELVLAADRQECSLGVVRVHGAARLRAVEDPGEWTEAQAAILTRQSLFGRQLRPLERVPWKFVYDFQCGPDCPGHSCQVFDWEAYALYRNQLAKKCDTRLAAADVEHRYNVELNPETHAIHLFVGTHYLRRSQFSVIGVFYPPA